MSPPSPAQVRKRVQEIREEMARERQLVTRLTKIIERRMTYYSRNSLTWRELNSLKVRIQNEPR